MGLSDFFGGSKSKSVTTSFTPEQRQWLTEALSVYGPTVGKGADIYQGARVAPMTDLQTGVLKAAPDFLRLFGAPTSVERPLAGQTGATISGLLTGQTGAESITPEAEEKYFQQSIYNPTMRMLEKDILPLVEEGYAGGNFFGSARGKARGEAISDVGRYLGEQRSNLAWDVLGRNQELAEAKAGRALSAVPQAIQYGREPAEQTMNNLRIAAGQVAGMQELFGIGAAEQTQEQREIQAAIVRFAEEHQLTDPQSLAVLLQLLGMDYTTSESYSKGPGLGYSMLSSFAGGFGQGLGSNF